MYIPDTSLLQLSSKVINVIAQVVRAWGQGCTKGNDSRLKNTDTKQPVPTNFKTAVLEVVCVVECPQCSLHGADHVADGLDLILVARLERSTCHRIHFRDLGYCNIVCTIITAR